MLNLNGKKDCEKNAETLKADRLASKLSCNDFNNCWKDIKKTNNAKLQTPSNVGGACGAENVRNMWLDHYQALLNSIPGSPVHISKIDTYCKNITFHDQMTINVKEMCENLCNARGPTCYSPCSSPTFHAASNNLLLPKRFVTD